MKTGVGIVRSRQSAGQSLGEEPDGDGSVGAVDEAFPSGEAPLSKVERSPELLHVGAILEHTPGGVAEIERLSPSSMSRNARGQDRLTHGAPNEAEPFNAAAPRDAQQPRERAEERFRKGVHTGVREIGRAASTDHEPEAGEGHGDREIAKIKEGFDVGGMRRRGELRRDPVGDQGKEGR